MAEFAFGRRKSLRVLTVEANYPLVEVGGKRELSEEYFDGANVSARRANILSGYDIALCGGEPYANWV